MIDSLRRAGDEKIRLIRQEAEQEAESLRTDVSRRIEELRKRRAEELAAAEGEETRRALAEAGNRARALRLAAETTLSDRLYSIALSSLHQLRDAGYPAVFEKLVLELPAFPWKRVRVHPADVGLARQYFPDAEIVPAETISGGVDVTVTDASIRVINTYEKRLERAWNELLPAMVGDVYREVSHGASSGSR